MIMNSISKLPPAIDLTLIDISGMGQCQENEGVWLPSRRDERRGEKRETKEEASVEGASFHSMGAACAQSHGQGQETCLQERGLRSFTSDRPPPHTHTVSAVTATSSPSSPAQDSLALQ